MKPIIVAQGRINDQQLQSIKQQYDVLEVIDVFDKQLAELFRVRFPSVALDSSQAQAFINDNSEKGAWIVYPWRHSLLHVASDDILYALRTNRNKQLVNEDEQALLHKATIGVAGMSVGSGIALALVYSGMSQTIKIADRDVLDTSNLNRLRESLLSIGKPKTELAAQHIYELDPYAEVITFNEGVTRENIDKFFTDPKLDVVIDEIDDFKVKVLLRLHAKKYQTPLLMFTSLGDNILIDVERYDLDAELPIFNGQLGDVPESVLATENIGTDEIRKFSVQLVGQEYIPTRALLSVAEMGKTTVGRPQLYSTIAVDGGLAAYMVRQILLGRNIASGRYFIRFADLVGLSADDLADTPERHDILARIFHGK